MPASASVVKSNMYPYPFPDRVGVNGFHTAEFLSSGRYVNVMRSCKAWPGTPTVDADGYPTAVASIATTIWNASGAYHRAGVYTVTFDGTGTISITGDATAPTLASGQTFTIVTPNLGITVTVNNGAAAPDNVRNIDIRHSTHLGLTGHIDPDYATFMRGAGSIIRAMDLVHTNDSPEVLWANRPTTTRYSWNSQNAAAANTTVRGTPCEVLIQMANDANCDLWWSVPHQVDDDYVTQFATLCAASLSGRLWVEYSNEIWNAQFGQRAYCNTQGGLLNPALSIHQFQGYRSIQVWDLVLSAYGNNKTRIVNVLSGRQGFATELNTAMTYIRANGGDRADVVAAATYFGGPVGTSSRSPLGAGVMPTTLAEFFTSLDASWTSTVGSSTSILDGWTTFAAEAKSWGVPIVAYEGGFAGNIQSADGWAADSGLQDLFNSAVEDARMETAYYQWLMYCKQYGWSTVMHYADIDHKLNTSSASRWGLSWGLSGTARPRWDALNFVRLQPPEVKRPSKKRRFIGGGFRVR